jgi:GT2 family glycosyltransferase
VEPDALERAVGHLRHDPALAGLGAYLIGPDGKLQRYYRRLPTLADLPVILFEPLFRSTTRGRRYLMSDDDFRGKTPVPQPPGSFLLFRRSSIDGALLARDYFNYMPDVDLCARLNQLGQVAVFDDVRCFHVGSAGGTGTSDLGLRLRLYQDLAWGVRHYFLRGPRSLATRAAVWTLLATYWVTRVGLTARRDWRYLARAIVAAAESMTGRPPTY